MRAALGVVALTCWAGAVSAQSLEEAVLTLESGGADFPVTRPEQGVVVGGDREVRLLDAKACAVRITDLDRAPFEVSSSFDAGAPKTDVRAMLATHSELYLGRAAAAVKAPQVLSRRNGVPVDQIPDGKWTLTGVPGSEIRCTFWPDGRKTCWREVEFERVSMVRGLSDQAERTARADAAVARVVELFRR